jgi:hypothetical protein
MDEPLNDPNLTQFNNPKITRGHLLILPCRINGAGKYWRHGVKVEVRDWLLENVGPMASPRAWEDDDQSRRWIYLGSNLLSWPKAAKVGYPMVVRFMFRELRDAMLMKLVWNGRL